MSCKVVCVVGGGISGLAAAQTLIHMSRKRGYPLEVVLLERTARLGGQIRTERFDNLTKPNSRVIIEAGAEGFVTRSTVFPRLGGMAGLGDDQIVDQKRIIDRELRFETEKRSWGIVELAPGIAAQKLGFQVPKEDRGRGIRSFRTGMSQLVEQISSNLKDVRLNSAVTGLSRGETGWDITYESKGTRAVIRSSAVILACPLTVMQSLVGTPKFQGNFPVMSYNSHVSVHLLVPRCPSTREIEGFTVPAELQGNLNGLRACSLVEEKFPDRCDPTSWLLRFYIRPQSDQLIEDDSVWTARATRAFQEVFGCPSQPTWSHVAKWKSALPVITTQHLSMCREFKNEVSELSEGSIRLIGSEVSGAGLDAAAMSGFEAAQQVLDTLH